MTPAVATGANVRHGPGGSPVDSYGDQHRMRKGSLTGDVPVKRIGSLDRDEPFREATEEINEENERKRR